MVLNFSEDYEGGFVAYAEDYDEVQNDLAPYLAIRRKYRLLRDEEITYLIDIIRSSDDPASCAYARAVLVYSNMGLIISVVLKHRDCGVAINELIGDVIITVYTRGINRFDPSMGYKFSTYIIYWIRCAIQRSIRQKRLGIPVWIPDYYYDALRFNREAERRFVKVNGCHPDEDELFEAVHRLEPKAAKAISRQNFDRVRCEGAPSAISLDKKLGPWTQLTLSDVLVAPENESAPSGWLQSDLRRFFWDNNTIIRYVSDSVSCMEDRIRLIFTLRYGLDGDFPLTLQEVGRRLGRSRERIRQIQKDHLRRIGRALSLSWSQVDAILLAMGDMVEMRIPTLSETSNVVGPFQDQDNEMLETAFSKLSEHAIDWRSRGELCILEPVRTLCVRLVISSIVSVQILSVFIAKGWILPINDGKIVKLIRLDQVPDLEPQGIHVGTLNPDLNVTH